MSLTNQCRTEALPTVSLLGVATSRVHSKGRRSARSATPSSVPTSSSRPRSVRRARTSSTRAVYSNGSRPATQAPVRCVAILSTSIEVLQPEEGVHGWLRRGVEKIGRARGHASASTWRLVRRRVLDIKYLDDLSRMAHLISHRQQKATPPATTPHRQGPPQFTVVSSYSKDFSPHPPGIATKMSIPLSPAWSAVHTEARTHSIVEAAGCNVKSVAAHD